MSSTDHDRLPTTAPKTRYYLATLGSTTRMGGVIISASPSQSIDGTYLAWVGDRVRYPDGSESTIVSGAGSAMVYCGKPAAIIGSATDNGDIVISSLQSKAWLEFREGENSFPGFLQPGYTAPAPCPTGDA